MKWMLKQAQNQLNQIIDAAKEEPQFIYSQESLVAAVVDPNLFQEFLNWQERTAKSPLAQVFRELNQLCIEENYTFEIPTRCDRPNPFCE